MAEAALRLPRSLPRGYTSGRSLAWWGVLLAILTEAVLFALLLFSYLFIWANAQEWPQDGLAPPELVKSGVRSIGLWASSATLAVAHRAAAQGRAGTFTRWSVGTLLLAAVFLAGHVEESLALEFTWQANAYASLFWLITNLHAVHLGAGMIAIGFAIAVVSGRGMTAHSRRTVEVAALYWHFVDGVWATVFACLYLLPRLA